MVKLRKKIKDPIIKDLRSEFITIYFSLMGRFQVGQTLLRRKSRVVEESR